MNAPSSGASLKRLMSGARKAQQKYQGFSQEEVDEIVTAMAWVVVHPERNQLLSELAVQDTELGSVEDKIRKNRRKTMGLLRDLTGAPSVGVMAEYPEKGITEIARPVGVVGALTPSTNPVATPTNMVMNALKGRNAIVLSPSPQGHRTAGRLVDFFRGALARLKAPVDLVQLLPAPVQRQTTRQLMLQVDLVVATGSERNVAAAYKSGTPALGVGKGNVPVIVDGTADLDDAASKIARSKTFDHATSCSSENSLIVIGEAYQQLLPGLVREGGVLLTEEEKDRLQNCLWNQGRLNRELVAKPGETLCRAAQLKRPELREAAFLMVEEEGVGPEYPFSGEKLSPILTLFRTTDFERAIERVLEILSYQGIGHSCGIHTQQEEQVLRLGLEVPVCRVIVNQAHCFANGGNFDNGLPFTLSMGCGTWGGDSIDENLNYKHFLNITRIARVIPPQEPTEEELFGAFHRKYGR